MALPNIIQNHTNDINTIKSTYVPLSGGTLTGAINFANNTWNTVGDDAYFGDCNVAGCVGVKGKNGETGVNFISKDGTTSSKLCISGSNLTINGNTIITSAGGEVKSPIYTTGNIPYELRHLTAENGDTTRDTATYQMLCVGLDKTGKRGGGVEVCYYTDGSRSLQFTQRNRADSGYNSLALREFADGTVYAQVNSQRIVCATQWISGINGYRKYSDGLIEQWGLATASHGGVINLHTSFASTNYCVYMLCENVDSHWMFAAYNRTTTNFNTYVYWSTNHGTGSVPAYWFARGY